jgi:hypothetical protein
MSSLFEHDMHDPIPWLCWAPISPASVVDVASRLIVPDVPSRFFFVRIMSTLPDGVAARGIFAERERSVEAETRNVAAVAF